MAAPDFEDAVLEVIRSLGPGEVATYGEIAAEAAFPGSARAVGNLLRRSEGLPWWRVVSAGGRLVPCAGQRDRRAAPSARRSVPSSEQARSAS